MLKVLGAIAIAVTAFVFGVGPASAETGSNQTQDFMCENAAYKSMHATDHKCDGAKSMASYGGGPAAPEEDAPEEEPAPEPVPEPAPAP